MVTNPNCSTIGLVMALKPRAALRITQIIVTTMQAVSGGRLPGVPSMTSRNVVPYIGSEEEKMEQRPSSCWGKSKAMRLPARRSH